MRRINLLASLDLGLADLEHVLGSLIEKLDNFSVDLIDRLALFLDAHEDCLASSGADSSAPSSLPAVTSSNWWPAAYCGSISHSREVAVALVASTGDCQGVGLDVVKKNAVSVKVGIRIMHPEEMHPSTGFTDTDWRAIVFSAKESVYKAVHPLIGEFLGFRDVEIKMNESDRSFAAATVKEGPSSKVVQAGVGFVTDFEGHWLTLFLV